MRRYSFLVMALTVAISLFPTGSASGSDTAPVDPLIDEIADHQGAFVHVRPGASLEAARADVMAAGATLGTSYEEIGVFMSYGTAEVFHAVALSPSVEWIEGNWVLEYYTDTLPTRPPGARTC